MTDEEWLAFNQLLNDEVAFNIDYDPLRQLNECEKMLTKNNPLCALSIYANRQTAEYYTILYFGINGHNVCSDAFRHALFNALNSQSCSLSLAKDFADAHEVCNGQVMGPQLEATMDLSNNEVGRNIQVNNPTASPDDLPDLILTELSQGNLQYIYPRSVKNKIISTSQIVNSSICN